jgi:transketolase
MATFATMRACEQVRTDICYNNLPVRIVATHGGLTTAGATTTGRGHGDRPLPAEPDRDRSGDLNQIGKVIEAFDWEGLIYIRIGRGGSPPSTEEYWHEIGKAITFKEGAMTVIATGAIPLRHCRIGEVSDGIDARVIDMHTVKLLDREW